MPSCLSDGASKEEARLLTLVEMVRDWIARSFSPDQEARFKEKGRLSARFQVELGSEMTQQLQAFLHASFSLKLLKLRIVQRERPSSGKPPQEFVEVAMDEAARSLYAAKCPDAVAKYRQQVEHVKGSDEGLVDADEGLEALEDRRMALEAGRQPALENRKRPATAREEEDEGATLAPASKKRSVQTAGASEGLAERRGPASAATPAKAHRAAAERPANPAPHDGGSSSSGSVWAACAAQPVRAGPQGLQEAKDALDGGLARIAAGGINALKAEKEMVGWLKGLGECHVTVDDLRATKIGLAVNGLRKHSEPYISGLATALLTTWKKAYRDAEKAGSKSAD